MRAFVAVLSSSSDSGVRQELNQSPLPFIEARQPTDAHLMISRKDTIIRVRNAQVRGFHLAMPSFSASKRCRHLH